MIDKLNIINLNSYIRISSIKEQFEDSCLYVTESDQIPIVYNHINIIFENYHLKNEFFEYLIMKNINHTVINCMSSLEIFKESLWDARGIVIFDNVCCCKNNDILEEVINYKKKKMLVC